MSHGRAWTKVKENDVLKEEISEDGQNCIKKVIIEIIITKKYNLKLDVWYILSGITDLFIKTKLLYCNNLVEDNEKYAYLKIPIHKLIIQKKIFRTYKYNQCADKHKDQIK